MSEQQQYPLFLGVSVEFEADCPYCGREIADYSNTMTQPTCYIKRKCDCGVGVKVTFEFEKPVEEVARE